MGYITFNCGTTDDLQGVVVVNADHVTSMAHGLTGANTIRLDFGKKGMEITLTEGELEELGKTYAKSMRTALQQAQTAPNLMVTWQPFKVSPAVAANNMAVALVDSGA